MDYRLVAVDEANNTLANLEFGHWVELPEAIDTILAEVPVADAIARIGGGSLIWVWHSWDKNRG